MRRTIASLCFLAAVGIITACGSDSSTSTPKSNIVTFKANMNAASEVQTNPVTSSGTGTFTATLDTVTNVFTYDVTYSGLGSNVTLGHIHGPASTTASAPAILNFATLSGATFVIGATSGTAHGQTTLTSATQISTTVNGDSLKKLLLAGLTYANVHTTTYGQGEIRGQIQKQ